MWPRGPEAQVASFIILEPRGTALAGQGAQVQGLGLGVGRQTGALLTPTAPRALGAQRSLSLSTRREIINLYLGWERWISTVTRRREDTRLLPETSMINSQGVDLWGEIRGT